ncbi:MAG: hypothetical protein EOO46_21480 [Flavobacterium sp.]|nr:MAG: hypothetical protein EOO46_21480 [Flavobacterium sp.]
MNHFKLFLISMTLCSCSPNKFVSMTLCSCSPNKFGFKAFETGTYVREDFKNQRLDFNRGGFAYIENMAGSAAIYCCDTIAKGTYTVDYVRQTVRLSSPESLNNALLPVVVLETEITAADSILIDIINPVESSSQGGEAEGPKLYYKIKLEGDGDQKFFDSINARRFEQSSFTIGAVPANSKLKSISIDIFPNFQRLSLRNYSVKSASTLTYQIKDSKTNHFKISIPELDMGFLTFLRLNQDIISIINTDRLEWDGNYYSKEK